MGYKGTSFLRWTIGNFYRHSLQEKDPCIPFLFRSVELRFLWSFMRRYIQHHESPYNLTSCISKEITCLIESV